MIYSGIFRGLRDREPWVLSLNIAVVMFSSAESHVIIEHVTLFGISRGLSLRSLRGDKTYV